MKLVDILNQWFKEHSQTEFAEVAGVKQSTVSRWKNAQVPPDFENCLRIAKALNEDPLTIFKAADRPEFAELYKFFFPNYQPKPEPIADPGIICDEHKKLHMYFERILHEGGPMGEWLAGSMVAFYEHLESYKSPDGTLPEAESKKHGPFANKTQMEPGDKVRIIRRPR